MLRIKTKINTSKMKKIVKKQMEKFYNADICIYCTLGFDDVCGWKIKYV
jgi:hypothetical protein